MKRWFCAALLLMMLCGMSAYAECSHNYSEWKVFREATDSSYGVNFRKCQKCGKYEYENFYSEDTLYSGVKDKEAEITELQTMLNDLGYFVKADGYYSTALAESLKQFQKDNDLEVTGIAYPQTRERVKACREEAAELGYVLVRIDSEYYRCGNRFIDNSKQLFNADEVQRSIKMYNAAFDALKETHPEVQTYFYFVDTWRSLTLDIEEYKNGKYILKEEIDPISPIYALLQEGLHVDGIDHFKLSSVSEAFDNLYATDHHWNYKGSYQGYLDCVHMMLGEDEEVLVPSGVKVFPFAFNGSAVHDDYGPVSDDYFTVYLFDNQPEYVSYVNDKKKTYNYSKKYMEGYNGGTYANHYALYYGADYGKVVFVNEESDGPNLLMIGSSYSNAVKTLLTQHYRNIVYVDPRHYVLDYHKAFSISQFVEEYDIDQILVLCGANLVLTPDNAVYP